jgi:effector-binding domain-containing protein
MSYEIQRQTVSTPLPTAVVRRLAAARELPKVIPDACGVVWRAIKAHGVQGAGRHVAQYLDDQINLEVGVELTAPLPAPLPADGGDRVIASALPVGTVATTVHFGPYPQLSRAHDAIRDWCDKHSHTLAGPNWEIYGHWEQAWNADPSQIRTDIYYLLRS